MSELDFVCGFRGSVNRWECDENDHLNVRFYLRMVWESLSSALPTLGVRVPNRVVNQHLRFVAEARIATPITGRCALVFVGGETLRVLTELRNTLTGQVLASAVSTVQAAGHGIADCERELPQHAGPRGLDDADSPLATSTMDEVDDLGLVEIGHGVIRAEELGANRELQTYGYMGRLSDSMPNLWSHLQTEEEMRARSEGFQGGAVLEYRMAHHGSLREGSGYSVRSGLRHVGDKIQQFEHLMYDVETRRCVMSASAVGIVLDLQTRRSMVIPQARRERMLKLLIAS